MRKTDQIRRAYEAKIHELSYVFCHYKKFDYDVLKYIYFYYSYGGSRNQTTYNDIIIMCDSETSKKEPDTFTLKNGKKVYKTGENHIVAWTISIRAFHHNICTLYGRKPSKMAETMLRIHEHLSGAVTFFYFHNLSFDHFFMRKFWYRLYGTPVSQLNTKSHYPIYIEFSNGIIIKDSLILAQRKLEKWADDLDVEHKKSVGKWDYEKIRDQNTPLNTDELEYIEHDTLAGVECIDATLQALNKKIYTIPYTATGIPREQTYKRGKKHAHDQFLKMALSYDQYIKETYCYHGGYTHGNRHYLNTTIDWAEVKAYDFASSYPFTLCAYKFPMEKFTPIKNCNIDFILSNMNTFSFMFKFIAVNIKLKTDAEPMPALQYSKAIKTINVILDNGRILAANYVEIYLTEWDLAVIAEQYTWEKHICCEVEFAKKDYLPRWFTDYVFECFTSKTMLKGGDPVLYSIAKSTVNSLYGMCCQHSIRNDIEEDYLTGEYVERILEDPEAEYQKYVDKVRSILPYQWGVTTTSIAFYNVHMLARCCSIPLYMDTDSCYGIGWNEDKIAVYNQSCKDKLRTNGYGPVIRNGREYWLGVAEHEGDKDTYTEFRYVGAKRYCGRCKEDNKLHITVAGVPKKRGAACLKSINDFHPGFVFSGDDTGKKTHLYFNKEEIYIDKNGNETGDSISLIPCDYELDSVTKVNWELLFNEEVEIQVYEDEFQYQ